MVKKIFLQESEFEGRVDFRQADLTDTEKIYLEGSKIELGELYFDSELFSNRQEPLFFIVKPPSNLSLHYKRLEIVYSFLKNNFLKQGQKKLADEVMYKLGMHREEVLKEKIWTVYGFFFGYGYKPLEVFAFSYSTAWVYFFLFLLLFLLRYNSLNFKL